MKIRGRLSSLYRRPKCWAPYYLSFYPMGQGSVDERFPACLSLRMCGPVTIFSDQKSRLNKVVARRRASAKPRRTLPHSRGTNKHDQASWMEYGGHR
jgi:hypothetical protein